MNPAPDQRIERDSLGEVAVPADAYWGAQTGRARENFPAGSRPFPPPLIHALGQVKLASARANAELNELPAEVAALVVAAAGELAARSGLRQPVLFEDGDAHREHRVAARRSHHHVADDDRRHRRHRRVAVVQPPEHPQPAGHAVHDPADGGAGAAYPADHA